MSLKKQAVTGLKWSFLQQISIQVINFAVQIILARLLMPEMFGLIAMIVILMSIGQMLIDGGMTSSLIRTDQPTQSDYSTVFIVNLITSIVLYFIVFSLAPYVAQFYNQEVLINIIRVFALTFIIRALVAVHIAKLTKEMNFKLQMQLQIPSTLVAGSVGIYLAYIESGVWSLVWMNVVQAMLFTLTIWICQTWRPSLDFKLEKFKYHFNFGYKLTLAGLIDVIFNDMYRIIIGKFYSPAQVGYFHQAEQLRLLPVQQISTVISKVTYPLFSKMNNDNDLTYAYKITMQILLLITVPLMLSLILVAEEIFRFLLGSKWLPAVEIFQILAIASIFRPLSAYNLDILKVKGRSDIFLKIEILKKVIGVIILILGFNFGFNGLIWAVLGYSFISYVINMVFSGRLICYYIIEQIKDSFIIYLVGFLIFSFLLYLKSNDLIVLYNDFVTILLYMGIFYITYYLVIFSLKKDLCIILFSLRK